MPKLTIRVIRYKRMDVQTLKFKKKASLLQRSCEFRFETFKLYRLAIDHLKQKVELKFNKKNLV